MCTICWLKNNGFRNFRFTEFAMLFLNVTVGQIAHLIGNKCMYQKYCGIWNCYSRFLRRESVLLTGNFYCPGQSDLFPGCYGILRCWALRFVECTMAKNIHRYHDDVFPYYWPFVLFLWVGGVGRWVSFAQCDWPNASEATLIQNIRYPVSYIMDVGSSPDQYYA